VCVLWCVVVCGVLWCVGGMVVVCGCGCVWWGDLVCLGVEGCCVCGWVVCLGLFGWVSVVFGLFCCGYVVVWWLVVVLLMLVVCGVSWWGCCV
jgi:hypothetical protein